MPPNTLALTGVTKSYGDRALWSDLTFELDAGEILALRGNSGSGKSTLLNAIGLVEPIDSGTITLNKTALKTGHRKTRVATMSNLFQDYALIDDATVAENLDVVGRPKLFSAKRDYSAELDRVGLSGRQNSPVYQLSGGEQQRVALARLMIRPTPIVLADEPTAALDDHNTAIVLETLAELARAGRIIIIATHSNEVAAIATHTLNLTPAPSKAPA